MTKFTYLPGPGDYTIMLLDPHSSFATIDWERIGWEEGVRRANLFCASESMLALLEKAYPIIEEEAERRSFSYCPEKDDDNPYWIEMAELRDALSAEIDRAYGKEVKSDVN
jgi:hypothetical protein